MGIRLPVDLETCELIPERWANFMAWDPVVMAETRGAGLKKLKAPDALPGGIILPDSGKAKLESRPIAVAPMFHVDGVLTRPKIVPMTRSWSVNAFSSSVQASSRRALSRLRMIRPSRSS